MFVLASNNWIGEREVIVKCRDKEQAVELFTLVFNKFKQECLNDGMTEEEFKQGFGTVEELTLDIPYETRLFIEDITPQEIVKLEQTPNNLGGCEVMTAKEFKKEIVEYR